MIALHSSPPASRPPRLSGQPAHFRGLDFVRCRSWYGRGGRAAAAVLIGCAVSCNLEDASGGPESGKFNIYPSDLTLYEFDSVQLSARMGSKPLPPGSVRWSVSDSGFATVSATGRLKAIRATDFDQPASVLGWDGSVVATWGTRSTSRELAIHGWRKPWGPGLDSVAYLETPLVVPRLVDEAGVDFRNRVFYLSLTCGTVAPGRWTVEISPYYPENPRETLTRRLFAADTVSVVIDSEPPRLERWERVGARIRAADGDEVVRQMRRARSLSVIAKSYTPDAPLSVAFRVGNVEQVTQAAIFAACD